MNTKLKMRQMFKFSAVAVVAILGLSSCGSEEVTADKEWNYSNKNEISVNSIPLSNGFIQFRTEIVGDSMQTIGLRENLDTALFFSTSNLDNFKDTIFDFNRDGLNDYAYTHYPVNGCCPRNFMEVYLNNGNEIAKEAITISNPFFNEGKIYSMDYGFPNQVSIIENEWKGSVLLPSRALSLNYELKGDKMVIGKPSYVIDNLVTNGAEFTDSIPEEFYRYPNISWIKEVD